jgi:hypothetical protein
MESRPPRHEVGGFLRLMGKAVSREAAKSAKDKLAFTDFFAAFAALREQSARMG